jgi:hypothetical protein
MEHGSPGPKLIESFNTNLPQLGVWDGPATYKSVKPSGTTTSMAIPPTRLLCSSPQLLANLADEKLADVKVKGTPQSPNLVTHRHTPSDLQISSNGSEADVIAAFHQYVFTEICEVLKIVYPRGWKFSCETNESAYTKISKPKRKDKDSDMAQSDQEEFEEATPDPEVTENLRYDLLFQELRANGETSNTEAGKTIAVIEFKKSGQIRYSDFEQSLVSASRKKFGKTPELEYNALSYTKQVCKYAQKRGCAHVALFNWDHLLLYNFYQLGKTQPTNKKTLVPTAGAEAGLIWVCEDTKVKEEFIHNMPMRKVMLGWLLQAFKEHFKTD